MRLDWSGRTSTLVPGREGQRLVPGRFRPTTETLVFRRYKSLAREPEDAETLGDVAETSSGRIISADAYFALAALADQSIDCIYIDPPFNTGRDFGDYSDGLDQDLWLTLLRDRLEDSARLLRSTGSIWVHLDHRSSPLVRLLCDEIFGAENFLAEMIWEKNRTRANSSRRISTQTDPILVYRRSPDFTVRRELTAPTAPSERPMPDGDARAWKSQSPTAPGTEHSTGLVYGIANPFTGRMIYPPAGRHWNVSQSEAAKILSEWTEYEARVIDDLEHRARLCAGQTRPGVPALLPVADAETAEAEARARYAAAPWPKWYFTKGGRGGIRAKSHISDQPVLRTPSNLIGIDDLGITSTGAKHEIRSLFPDRRVFSTPKPEALLGRILAIATEPGDTVLDFFAGSATTAAAAHKMGRNWIVVEREDDTVRDFIVPRMQRVISGSDLGGISTNRAKSRAQRKTLSLGGGDFSLEAATSLPGEDGTPTEGKP